jgi:hypothetical protein
MPNSGNCMACGQPALNQLGLRLRKPWPRKAVWSPDVAAFLCRKHAEAGGVFKIEYLSPVNTNTVDIEVSHAGQNVATKSWGIKKPAA